MKIVPAYFIQGTIFQYTPGMLEIEKYRLVEFLFKTYSTISDQYKNSLSQKQTVYVVHNVVYYITVYHIRYMIYRKYKPSAI